MSQLSNCEVKHSSTLGNIHQYRSHRCMAGSLRLCLMVYPQSHTTASLGPRSHLPIKTGHAHWRQM